MRIPKTKRPEGQLRIGEIARRAGVGRGTIQHYLREGLLPGPVKTHRNMGYYDPACVERITLIQQLRETRHMPLAEIRRVLGRGVDAGSAVARTLVDAQRVALASLGAHAGAKSESLSIDDAAKAFGFAPEMLRRLQALDIIEMQERDGREVIEGPNLEVLAAISNLARLGFTKEAGFSVDGIAAYQRSVEALVNMEFEMFLSTLGKGAGRSDPVGLSRGAIDGGMMLIIALRKRRIADVVASLSSSTRGPRAGAPRRRARASRARVASTRKS